MNLTPRDNFHRLMRRDFPGWVPLDVPVTPPVAERVRAETGESDVAAALGGDFRTVNLNWPVEPGRWRAAYEALGVALPEDTSITAFGITRLTPPRTSLGEAWHLEQPFSPLAGVNSVRELESLPWPDPDDPALAAPLPEAVARVHEAGLAAVGASACTLFEHAWYLRSMEALFMDLMEGEPVGTWLLDWFTRRSEAAARAYCEAGVDVILLGDDVGTQRGMMMAPDFWREHLKPRLARVIETIRAHERGKVWVLYHTDGAVGPVIGELAEIGVDILNPVQPECMDVQALAAEHGHRLGFWGMIGTQTTLPFGRPADVRSRMAEIARLARAGQAVIAAPTHVLEPDVPWENIAALAGFDRRLAAGAAPPLPGASPPCPTVHC